MGAARAEYWSKRLRDRHAAQGDGCKGRIWRSTNHADLYNQPSWPCLVSNSVLWLSLVFWGLCLTKPGRIFPVAGKGKRFMPLA